MAKKREINVIVLGPKGYLDAQADLQERASDTRLGFQALAWRQSLVHFHRSGRRFRVKSAALVNPPASWVRFVPTLLYNPWVQVAYAFEDVGGYTIDELVAGVEAAVRQDDDIITQFRDVKDLLGRLSRAKTFDGVAAAMAYARVGL